MPLMRKKKLRKIRKIRIRRELSREWNSSLTINASLADISPGVQGGGDARLQKYGLRDISRHHQLRPVP